MQAAQLEVGRAYAYRERRSADVPLLKVRLVEKVGRKGAVKVRFESGPHVGLEEYIRSRQLVIRWGDRKLLLRDERRTAELDAYAERVADKTLAEAASLVLDATGEPAAYVGNPVTGMPEDELQRICDRAGLTTPPVHLHRLGFCDRFGTVHLPLDTMVAVAQAFAAAEPETVTLYLDDQGEELRLKGTMPGERWYHQYLREQGPAVALARRWAGLEQEAEALRREIARLRVLVSRAASDLKGSGAEREAHRLLRALEGR